jgi:hypothetical protein
MAFQPQGTSGKGRVDAGLSPPCRFIATAVNLAMMATTQGHSELIADFAAKRLWLRKPQMMSVCWAATANYARLFGNQSNVIPVANPPRRRQRQHGFVYCGGSAPLFALTLTRVRPDVLARRYLRRYRSKHCRRLAARSDRPSIAC